MTSDGIITPLDHHNSLDYHLSISMPPGFFELIGYRGNADMLAIHYDEHGDLLYFDGCDHLGNL